VIRFKQTVSLAAVVLLAMVVLNGCSPKRAGEVLARVGDTVITTEDFKQEVQWRVAHNAALPEKGALLDEMVSRELALQKAKALGLEKSFDVQRTYQEMLVGELKDRELMPKVEAATVSSQEIQEAYTRDIAKYTNPAKSRLALIYIKINSKMTAEQKATAEARMTEAANRAKGLTDASHGFGSVAMDFSEDQASRYRGGDVGWVDEGEPVYRWPKEVVAAGLGLEVVGEISPTIRTSNGLYLVMKTDVRDKAVMPLAKVSASIQRRLIVEKKQQIEQSFATNLRAATPVHTDPVALLQVDYPTTKVAQVEEKLPPALPRSQ
jgi:peptidyl-prolyl cis-trans isomerase C